MFLAILLDFTRRIYGASGEAHYGGQTRCCYQKMRLITASQECFYCSLNSLLVLHLPLSKWLIAPLFPKPYNLKYWRLTKSRRGAYRDEYPKLKFCAHSTWIEPINGSRRRARLWTAWVDSVSWLASYTSAERLLNVTFRQWRTDNKLYEKALLSHC